MSHPAMSRVRFVKASSWEIEGMGGSAAILDLPGPHEGADPMANPQIDKALWKRLYPDFGSN